ncbi:hypothetical protein [Gilvimarinus polysaccharolyticus]|uniref:hypothetical protein n=1 Tax=Gilvimarinus polysaccharolyticus TaxID=863921 RepID=UPI0006736D95|nr:hypothetical protein [Gilvimarinus polysaccharolyticus]
MSNFNSASQVQQQNLEQASSHNAGLTELVLAHGAASSWSMILPMVAHLCRQDSQRWLTWVTSEPLPAALLISFGIDPLRLRQVHCRDSEQQLWVTWDALELGNSHTVIASPGTLSQAQERHLEQAAYAGNSQALILRYR